MLRRKMRELETELSSVSDYEFKDFHKFWSSENSLEVTFEGALDITPDVLVTMTPNPKEISMDTKQIEQTVIYFHDKLICMTISLPKRFVFDDLLDGKMRRPGEPPMMTLLRSNYDKCSLSSHRPSSGNHFAIYTDNSVGFISAEGMKSVGYLGKINWSLIEPKPKLYEGKIISFVYNGGSEYGAKRVVKVEQEDSKGISGMDLEKMDERRYLFEKMKNPVVIK